MRMGWPKPQEAPVVETAKRLGVSADIAVRLHEIDAHQRGFRAWSEHPIVAYAGSVAWHGVGTVRVKDEATFRELQWLWRRSGLDRDAGGRGMMWWGVRIEPAKPSVPPETGA